MKEIDLILAAQKSSVNILSEDSAFDNIYEDARIVINDTESQILLKTHLVIICKEGEISFISGGVTHTCKAGTFCILVKDSVCRFIYVSNDCHIAAISSETNIFHLASSTIPNLMIFYRRFRENPSFLMTEHEMQDALYIYKGIKSISDRSEYIYRKEIRGAYDVALFHIIFAHVPRNNFKSDGHISRQSDIYNKFLSHVGEHFMEERKLDYYASLQCISPKHLSFAVKNESGISAHQWISDFVMIQARELLARKELSVQNVADMMHFADQSFFGKYFKAHEGISPLQYQQSLNQ